MKSRRHFTIFLLFIIFIACEKNNPIEKATPKELATQLRESCLTGLQLHLADGHEEDIAYLTGKMNDFFDWSYSLYPLETFCGCTCESITAINEVMDSIHLYFPIHDDIHVDKNCENGLASIAVCSLNPEKIAQELRLGIDNLRKLEKIGEDAANLINSFINEALENPINLNFCEYINTANNLDFNSDRTGSLMAASFIGLNQHHSLYVINKLGVVNNNTSDDDIQAILGHVLGGLFGAWSNAITGILSGDYDAAGTCGGKEMLEDMAYGFVFGAIGTI